MSCKERSFSRTGHHPRTPNRFFKKSTLVMKCILFSYFIGMKGITGEDLSPFGCVLPKLENLKILKMDLSLSKFSIYIFH